MLLNYDEYDKVEGEIYKITNKINNKSYIGQTRTHRLNHKKYRPFGYLGRFRDHISEANSNKKKQSRYLNSAILKYGSENFICEKLAVCKIEELDIYERKYISECNSKYPNGYNLTDGGQNQGSLKGTKILLDENEIVKPEIKNNKNLEKSEYTKDLISKRLKEFKSDGLVRKKQMEMTQMQHMSSKFERYKNVVIDKDNIEKYIFVVNNNKLNYQYITVKINNIKTGFIGRYEKIENIRERALNFIQDLINWQHDQIAGTPLEPSLPLLLGNM